MKKIVFRVLIILALSGLVSGILFLIVNNSASASLPFNPDSHFRPPADQNGGLNPSQNQAADQATSRSFPDRERSGSLELFGLVQHLLAIAAITFVVVMIQKLYGRVVQKSARKSGSRVT